MNSVILTKEMIEACRTDRGGFSGHTTKVFALILGEEIQSGCTLKTGWTERARGLRVSEETYKEALKGRNLRKKDYENQPTLF